MRGRARNPLTNWASRPRKLEDREAVRGVKGGTERNPNQVEEKAQGSNRLNAPGNGAADGSRVDVTAQSCSATGKVRERKMVQPQDGKVALSGSE